MKPSKLLTSIGSICGLKFYFYPHQRFMLYFDVFVLLIYSPKEPPPPPAPEPEWSETPSDVNHLQDSNFKDFVKKKKHVLVMFYAPCKTVYFNHSHEIYCRNVSKTSHRDITFWLSSERVKRWNETLFVLISSQETFFQCLKGQVECVFHLPRSQNYFP